MRRITKTIVNRTGSGKKVVGGGGGSGFLNLSNTGMEITGSRITKKSPLLDVILAKIEEAKQYIASLLPQEVTEEEIDALF